MAVSYRFSHCFNTTTSNIGKLLRSAAASEVVPLNKHTITSAASINLDIKGFKTSWESTIFKSRFCA